MILFALGLPAYFVGRRRSQSAAYSAKGKVR
jgi:hypothetical protein